MVVTDVMELGIYLLLLVPLLTLVLFPRNMLSKMMRGDLEARESRQQIGVSKKKTIVKDSEVNGNKKSPHTNELLPPKEQKRMKPNLKSTNAISARGNATTNWEKFRDVVKESSDDQKKDKNKNTNGRPFSRHKRNFNNVGNSASTVPAAHTSVEESKENKTMEKKRNLLTKHVAMDCEMVGIGDGSDSMLARVSLVNRYGDCIYDKYVKPREKVLDYRTAVSGIRPHHLYNGEDFETVQREVAEILNERILVGHALKHDMDVLFLSHPRRLIRDTSRYKQFRKVSKGNTPGLKKLAAELLGLVIQEGEHSSVEDARTAMQLYVLYKNQWEMDIRSKR